MFMEFPRTHKIIVIQIIHAIIWENLAVLIMARYIQFLEISTTPKM